MKKLLIIALAMLLALSLVACNDNEGTEEGPGTNNNVIILNPEGTGTSHYYFPNGTWYTIPYRSLIPKEADADNLLVGGRCISVDHEAQASVRIIPICTTTGEAAGVGAAVAARDGVAVQSADVAEIQRILVESGAYIGI